MLAALKIQAFILVLLNSPCCLDKCSGDSLVGWDQRMGKVRNSFEGFEGIDDGRLVSLTQHGSEVAFAELMRRHSRSMMQMALRILRNTEDAEDELQNAWSKAWQHIDGFAGDARFSTWMTRIVINQSLMRLRGMRRGGFVYLDAAAAAGELRDGSSTPEESVYGREISELVRREIGRIPAAWRHALMLREVDQLPMLEVAEQLGISVSAAKSRLLRARQELRRRLEKCGGTMGAETLLV
jgi:RNA polymerase sigma-70 factor (ECF subfamily)